MKELVTNLFKSLIDNGYKYITNISKNLISFKINNKYYTVMFINSEYKEVEPIKFEVIDSVFWFGCNSVTNNPKTNECIFVIDFNGRYMPVKLSRVEHAEYLDKIEALANKWFEDQMINAINTIEYDTFEDNVD